MSDAVKVRTGRPRDPSLEEYVRKIMAMRIDDSVFVPGATRAQLEFLRHPVLTAGGKIELVQVESDEIYGTHGVRIYRREGSFDQL